MQRILLIFVQFDFIIAIQSVLYFKKIHLIFNSKIDKIMKKRKVT
jgi:hypothetical protein